MAEDSKSRAAADEPRRPTLTLDDESKPKLTIGDDDDDGDALVPAATPRLVSAYAAELEAQARPYEEAATRARDARFGFAPGSDEEIAVLEAAGYELLSEEEEEEDAATDPAETASDLPGRPQCRTRALL